MCENRLDAENRTPFFPVPQNEEKERTAAERTADANQNSCSNSQPSVTNTAVSEGRIGKPADGSDDESALKTSFFAHAADKWALPAALWMGYLYCRMLFGGNDFRWPFHIRLGGQQGLWFYCMPLLLAVVFCTGVILWCRLRRIKGGAESPLWLGCLMMTAFSFGFDRLNAAGWALGWLAFHGFALVWALARTGQLSENRTGPAFVPDVLRGVGRGFAGLAEWPRGVWALFAERPRRAVRSRRNVVPAVLCLMGGVVLLFLAAKELAAADDAFADLLQSLVDALVFWDSFSLDWSVIVSLIFMFPVGAFFYGLTVAGHAALAQTPRPPLQRYAAALVPLRQAPAGLLCGVLAAFAVLYLAFFGVQSGYLFGAFTGELPRGFTVAKYARQGFFELCRVMLLNFVLLVGADVVSLCPLRQHTGLKTGGAVLLVQSLLLWTTAASKLGLYIFTFGFTAKRLLAAWALLVLAVAGVRFLAGLWRRCSVLRPTVLVGAASFALLCLY